MTFQRRRRKRKFPKTRRAPKLHGRIELLEIISEYLTIGHIIQCDGHGHGEIMPRKVKNYAKFDEQVKKWIEERPDIFRDRSFGERLSHVD